MEHAHPLNTSSTAAVVQHAKELPNCWMATMLKGAALLPHLAGLHCWVCLAL